MWPKLFCWWEQILVQLNKNPRTCATARAEERVELSAKLCRCVCHGSIYCSPRWKPRHGQIVRAEIVAPPGMMMRGCWGARSEGDRASVRSSDGKMASGTSERKEGRKEDLEWEATSTKTNAETEKKQERERGTEILQIVPVWTGTLVVQFTLH